MRASNHVRAQIQGAPPAQDLSLAQQIDLLGKSFLLGYRQRSYHAENPAADMAGGVPEFPAAFHRITAGTNAVVGAMFKRFGMGSATCCLYSSEAADGGKVRGVIRIPTGNLLRPEDLWVLFHEAAHEFVGSYPVKFLQDATVEQVIEDIVKVGMERAIIKGIRRRRQKDWMECRRFVVNLFCDLFTFVFVYKRETELYLRTFGLRATVRQAQSPGSDGLDYFFRTLFVAVFEHVVNRKLDNIDKRLFAHYLGSANGFGEMSSLIRKHTDGSLDVSFQAEFVPFKDFVLPMVIEIFKLVMELHREVVVQAPINVEGFEKVERGLICYNLANPHQLVLDLWSYFFKLKTMEAGSREKLFVSRVATLLNLWHMAVLRPDEVPPPPVEMPDSEPGAKEGAEAAGKPEPDAKAGARPGKPAVEAKPRGKATPGEESKSGAKGDGKPKAAPAAAAKRATAKGGKEA